MTEINRTPKSMEELEGDSDVPEYDGLTVDEVMAKELRHTLPKNNGKFTTAIVTNILSCLEKGISVNTAAMASGVAPETVMMWYRQGKKDFESLTDEQLESASDNLEEVLTEKGKFFLRVNKAKSTCIVSIHEMLYERCFENNKEWLGTYILEREEPEKYNLKHRMTAEVDANTKTSATVEFKFTNGMDERPKEDKEYVSKKLDELDKQYSKSEDADDGTKEHI